MGGLGEIASWYKKSLLKIPGTKFNTPKFHYKIQTTTSFRPADQEMYAVYLKFGSHMTLRGMVAWDNMHIFSILDFTMLICHNKTEKYAKRVWNTLKKDSSNFMQLQQYFSSSIPITDTIPGTTVMGLQALMNVLGNRVNEDFRQIIEDTFARYIAGDWSMLTIVDWNSPVHEQNMRQHYNFKPPTASIIIEDAGAGNF